MAGYVLWEGLSRTTGKPVVVVLTLNSVNQKTGNMAQAFILCQDVPPGDAARNGEDASICGNCPLRGFGRKGDSNYVKRNCYVRVDQAPRSVWKTYRAGKYPFLPIAEYASVLAGRQTRIGAYGDPGAIPVEITAAIAAASAGHTGYTHQWADRPDLAPHLMASVASPKEAELAHSQGWRTFRTKRPDQARLPGEVVCPASAEAGHKLQCQTCLACAGTGTGRRGSVVIDLHGPAKVR